VPAVMAPAPAISSGAPTAMNRGSRAVEGQEGEAIIGENTQACSRSSTITESTARLAPIRLLTIDAILAGVRSPRAYWRNHRAERRIARATIVGLWFALRKLRPTTWKRAIKESCSALPFPAKSPKERFEMSTVGLTAEQFIRYKNDEWTRERDRNPPSIHWFKDIGGRAPKSGWVRERWTFLPDRGYPKVYTYERLRLVELRGKPHHAGGSRVGDFVERLGYWTVAKNRSWWWGQSAPMFRQGDLKKLMTRARHAPGRLIRSES
jgi:hypothetical protein